MTTKVRKVANIGNDVLETLGGGPISGFRNAIINGNFDIWQRGTSSSVAGYLADRWVTFLSGTTIVTTRQTFTLGQTDVPNEPFYYHRSVVTSVAGAGNLCLFSNRIENVKTFAGQTVTISFWAKADASRPIAIELGQRFGTGGSPSADVYTYVAKPTLTTSWAKYTYTIAVPSISGKTLGTTNYGYLAPTFWFDAGSTYNSRTNSLGQQSGTFDIAQVQVEQGSIATPFEQRSSGAELLLCQRYYEKSYELPHSPGSSWSINGGEGVGYGHPTASFRYYVPFRVSKRATPTLTFYDAAGTASKTSYFTSLWNNGGTISVGPVATENGFYCGHNGGSVIETQFAWSVDAEL